MRYLPPDVEALLPGPVIGWGAVVDSLRSMSFLEWSAPVTSGTWEASEQLGSGTLTLTLSGEEYLPGSDPLHAFAPYGQQVRPVIEVQRPGGGAARVPLGYFRISEAEESDDRAEVTLTCEDLFSGVVTPDRFAYPLSTSLLIEWWSPEYPQKPRTFANVLRLILSNAGPVLLDGVTDKNVGEKWVERDRDKLVRDLLDAWPARLLVDSTGTFRVVPAVTPTTAAPLFTITDGDGGTIVSAVPTSEASVDEVHNGYIVTGSSGGWDVYGSALADDPGSPVLWGSVSQGGGRYGQRPGFYHSDLITTHKQADDVAATMLAKSLAKAAQVWDVTAAPDPRYEIGDVGNLVVGGVTRLVEVIGVKLPLDVEGSPMQLTLREVTGGGA